MASTASNRREQLKRQQEAEAARKRTTRLVTWLAAVVALVLVGVLVAVLVGRGATPSIVPPNANADQTAIVVNREPAPASAPTVTLYLDYQCPNCRSFEEDYGAMLEDAADAGEWTLQYKTMTFMDNNLANTASTRAAVAAACSDVAGRYREYNTEVYANQEAVETRGSVGFSDELLRAQIPATVGITGDALASFQQCYDAKSTKGFVEGVDKSAYSDGVVGTPSIAVNGTVLDLAQVSDPTPAGLKAFLLASA